MIIQALMYPLLMWRVQEMGQLHMQELRNWIGMMSHPVALLQPYIVCSHAMTNRQVGVLKCGAGSKTLLIHNLIDHGDKQETWMMKIVCKE